ncbi:hypothetical protein Pla52o_21620 [Novipirellula galeiformis]|uniref:Uncharacterized protein n=1 Tax=Novipirellula galeiformis TaxID=2528004 RepID=A0A5C6CM53_9BACT|nr:hypothetical protein Pla52o_21620 [Novipirellula galeiformis]
MRCLPFTPDLHPLAISFADSAITLAETRCRIEQEVAEETEALAASSRFSLFAPVHSFLLAGCDCAGVRI